MLVLSRKAQEKIRIGEDIVITILRTKGKTVRVGIEAPQDLTVLRGELAFEQEHEAPAEPKRRAPAIKAEQTPGEHWPADEQPCVTHERVPKSRVATVLPAMLGDSTPLRAMLDRRSVAREF